MDLLIKNDGPGFKLENIILEILKSNTEKWYDYKTLYHGFMRQHTMTAISNCLVRLYNKGVLLNSKPDKYHIYYRYNVLYTDKEVTLP